MNRPDELLQSIKKNMEILDACPTHTCAIAIGCLRTAFDDLSKSKERVSYKAIADVLDESLRRALQ